MKGVDTCESTAREPVVAAIEHRPDPVRTLVGIPAYNEEVGIGSVVLAASEHADSVLVVDDGSTDETARIARRAGATVVRHDSNRGKGAAMRTIFEVAREVGCEILVVLDGDGQHLPSQIPVVMTPIHEGSAELVIGNRHASDVTGQETPLYRRFGQRALDRLTQLSTRTTVGDTQSGFRALSRDAIERITPETDGMGVESEMIHLASTQGLRIDEVPIDVRYEGVDGQTHNAIYHGLIVGLRVLRLSHRGVIVGAGGLAVVGFLFRRLVVTPGTPRRRTWSRLLGLIVGIGGGAALSLTSDRMAVTTRSGE